jgi:PleD family two-component response regulator
MYLANEGYDVQVATNGVDAIRIAQEYIPDLVLLDIILPGINGYLVCEALKDEMETKHIPIIFMSAKSQEEDIKKSFEVGGSDYIMKPFTHEEIQKLIDKYL